MLGRKKKVQDCHYVFGSSAKFQRRMNGFVKADICRQVSVCLHVFCGILFALKPLCDYSLCLVCILPQPAFYSQSAVCILHSVCILPLVRIIVGKIETSTTCVGLAASAAAVLLASGAPGQRYALPHARVLIHQPLLHGGLEGQASDIEIHAKEIVRQKEEMTAILSRHTGQTTEQVALDTDRDRWLTAQQAVDYGIVDSIMAPARLPVDL